MSKQERNEEFKRSIVIEVQPGHTRHYGRVTTANASKFIQS